MTHEQRYLKMVTSEKFKKLERLSKKTYLGSLQMDNDIKLTLKKFKNINNEM